MEIRYSNKTDSLGLSGAQAPLTLGAAREAGAGQQSVTVWQN